MRALRRGQARPVPAGPEKEGDKTMLNACAGFLFLVLTVAPLAPATPTATASSIPPVVWELVSLTGANGFHVDIADSSRYTLQFLPEGRMAAKLDCNQGSAGF